MNVLFWRWRFRFLFGYKFFINVNVIVILISLNLNCLIDICLKCFINSRKEILINIMNFGEQGRPSFLRVTCLTEHSGQCFKQVYVFCVKIVLSSFNCVISLFVRSFVISYLSFKSVYFPRCESCSNLFLYSMILTYCLKKVVFIDYYPNNEGVLIQKKPVATPKSANWHWFSFGFFFLVFLVF